MNRIFRWFATASAVLMPLFQTPIAAVPVSAGEPACRSVRLALEAGEITLTLEANESSFFDEPLTYSVENIAGDRLEFCFPAGMLMRTGDGGYQDLLLTQTVNVVLEPGRREEGRLSAVCANLSKDAPATGTSYQPGPMSDGDILRVAQAIENNSAQGRLGAQLAVWAVTDGLTLDDIGGDTDGDSADMFQLIAPLLCLAEGELELGQSLLEEADTEIRLFEGGVKNGMAFCRSLGFPTDINQIMLLIGQYSLIALCCCGGGCGLMLIVLAGGIVLIVRSRKH